MGGMAVALCLWAGAAIADGWDWQLSAPYDLGVEVDVLVLEPDELSAGDIADVAGRGVLLVCYLSIGSWEEWRADADRFPEAVLGRPLGDWPGERYLDIRARDVVVPLMAARIDACAAKGFRGIEPDNMDLSDNPTGFAITRADTMAYLAEIEAHARSRGMMVLQKNAPDLVPALVGRFDMALVEECFEYDFCDAFLPYVRAGKPVLVAEYADSGQDWAAVCARAEDLGFEVIIKDKEVVAGGARC